MFAHYSLRGVLAAIRAVRALAAKAGKAIKPIALPPSLQGNRGGTKPRRGMSAKSGYARWRSAHAALRMARGLWPKRLAPATGPGSYAEASPQDLIRKRRHDALLAIIDRRQRIRELPGYAEQTPEFLAAVRDMT